MQKRIASIRSIYALATLFFLAPLFESCSDGITSNASDVIFPSSNVSYSASVQPLFDLSCAVGGCHDAYTRAGNLSLQSYFDVISMPGLVVPGDSTRSLLVQVVSMRTIHSAYPISRLVTANQQRGIAVWVQEGASNN